MDFIDWLNEPGKNVCHFVWEISCESAGAIRLNLPVCVSLIAHWSLNKNGKIKWYFPSASTRYITKILSNM